MNNFVTEISEQDFRKLNIVAKEHRMLDFKDDDGREYRKAVWVDVELNKAMDEADAIAEKNGLEKAKAFIFAIHAPVPEGKTLDDGYYYLDKFLTQQSQTYLQMDCDNADIVLYSIRDYWEVREQDYFKIPKKDTSAVYLVRREI